MNRNQRRLGRMHQKRINNYESKKERHARYQREEQLILEKHEKTEREYNWRRDPISCERDGNTREADVRQERADRHNTVSPKFSPERLEKQGISDMKIEEVLPPQFKRINNFEKFTTNKCCYVAPMKEDFGQITEEHVAVESPDKYQNLLKEQYGFDPLMPETINQLQELRKVLCQSTPKVEHSSQYTSDKMQSVQDFAETDGSHWQTIDNADEIDKYLNQPKGTLESYPYLPEDVRICEIPHIKIIAKKFSRFKKKNVELRKLDEKVVCVEYDVFVGEDETPREKLRAFFSIKPTSNHAHEAPSRLPSKVKNNFNISDQDLKKLNEKEIEIIDGKITENKTYLEDLKRILRRKQALRAKKNKDSLDLMSLYEMAKKENPPLDDQFSNSNFLSKAELQEMKDLILRKCASSVRGISRRTVKSESASPDNMGVISQSIVTELLRESSLNE